MTLKPVPQSVAAFTRGDAGTAQSLTRALTVLRDRETDPQRREALDQVLDGRQTLRAFLRTEQGRDLTAFGAQTLSRQWDALTDEEKEAAREEGEWQLRRWRAEAEEDAARRRR